MKQQLETGHERILWLPFCRATEQTYKKNGSPRGTRKQIEETSRGNWISQGFGVAHY